MRPLKKGISRKGTLIFCGALLFFLSAVYFFFSTTAGATLIIRRILSRYVPSGHYRIGRIDGDLLHQVTLRDIVMADWRDAAAGSVLSIPKVDVYFISTDIRSLNIEFHRARLTTPQAEPLVFDGICQDGLFSVGMHFNKKVSSAIVSQRSREPQKMHRIVEHISVGADEEYKSEESVSNETQALGAHDAVFLQYKDRF